MSIGEGEGRTKGGEGASFINPKVNRQSQAQGEAPPPEAVLASDVEQTPPAGEELQKKQAEERKRRFSSSFDAQHGNR